MWRIFIMKTLIQNKLYAFVGILKMNFEKNIKYAHDSCVLSSCSRLIET